jgi:hypothetical protein
MAYKNIFTPTNIKKYIGSQKQIKCRSLWERQFCKYLDENKNVIQWGYECLQIPYIIMNENKKRVYIPDFVIKTQKDDKIKITVVEIKPSRQTKNPNARKRKNIQECLIYAMNDSKWKYAKEFCLNRGWNFLILTEKELFND